MTAQIADLVVFRQRSYSLAGVNGTGLFDPSEVGLEARSTLTSNWRGFNCRYVVDESRLTLDTVHIGLDQPTPLFGREPKEDGGAYSWVFSGLAHPIAFTGALLLGEGFIQELYVHMGFHPAWKYETVIELEFQDGRLTQVADLSEAARRFRSTLKADDLSPGAGSGLERVREWIARTFRLDYDPTDRFKRPK